MKPIVHDLRLSETITPFGVGAIADVRGESLIAPDTSWWDLRTSPIVHCDRLLNQLGGGELREPPTHAGKARRETAGLRYWRFPAWRFCERCQALSQLTRSDKGAWTNKCECGGFRVPMRYVAICEGGSHIQDIPWFQWAHRGNEHELTDENRYCKAYTELQFEQVSEKGEGLASLRVRCNACRRRRPLSELVQKSALLRDGIACRGGQPWQPEGERTDCSRPLMAVQRGATGNYIADRVSALDIPEQPSLTEERMGRIRAHSYFRRVVEDNGGPQAEMVAGWIAEELGIAAAEVLECAASTATPRVKADPISALKIGEWAAFVKKLEAGRDGSTGVFVVDGWPTGGAESGTDSISDVISHIGQVQKVREVRALRGFQRFDVSSELIPADLSGRDRPNPVYPTIELFGEGIFLRFDEGWLSDWESDPRVKARVALLEEQRVRSVWSNRLVPVEARFVALHTTAHLLIRQLAFTSGYSSASLQERIYASSATPDPTAGILIYTAAGDAQGTLGGLVRLGQPHLVLQTLFGALDEADVCSNDPVCIESDRQRVSQLNLSACHGCSLVSETSCETGNRLLDRQLVLGGSVVPGLLEDILHAVRSGE